MSDSPFRALLLDIEGTTTSISFVYDELFPYAREAAEGFLERNWGEPEVQSDVHLIHQQAAADREAGIDAPPVPAEPTAADVLANVLWQMDNDRKTTGLKSLQGRIWVDGYQSGQLKGHVYDEVPGVLEAMDEADTPVYIYSSGSVAAQKLLFGHSVAGDLTPLLSGYYDTTTGPKKEAGSYLAIAADIGVAAGEVMFVTDNLDEARAAREAGMQVRVSVRPGNHPLEAGHGFVVVHSMDEVS